MQNMPYTFVLLFEEMGHTQGSTPLQNDNKCAAGIVNSTVKQRASKSMGMQLYWVKDRSTQGQFSVHWRKGSENISDYFTKHHSPLYL